jgi:hypothetical protein
LRVKEAEKGYLMCNQADYSILHLSKYSRELIRDELDFWHDAYLPSGEVVLDVGACCGETALFYILHGAKRVICIEPYPKYLRYLHMNKAIIEKRYKAKIDILPYAINKIKMDAEGAEIGMSMEVHGLYEFVELNHNLLSKKQRAWTRLIGRKNTVLRLERRIKPQQNLLGMI